jgi:hypothetical protein
MYWWNKDYCYRWRFRCNNMGMRSPWFRWKKIPLLILLFHRSICKREDKHFITCKEINKLSAGKGYEKVS